MSPPIWNKLIVRVVVSRIEGGAAEWDVPDGVVRGEYKRGDIHQDDRCSAEIDGETKPPRCRDGA